MEVKLLRQVKIYWYHFKIKRLQEESKDILTHIYNKEEYPNIEIKLLPVFSMIDGKS